MAIHEHGFLALRDQRVFLKLLFASCFFDFVKVARWLELRTDKAECQSLPGPWFLKLLRLDLSKRAIAGLGFSQHEVETLFAAWAP